jgi:hypothetical protein
VHYFRAVALDEELGGGSGFRESLLAMRRDYIIIIMFTVILPKTFSSD